VNTETSAAPFADREVAITGRLVSMTRSDAVRRIAEAGGRYVQSPGSTTSYLVAGQATGYLTASGGISRNMARFRELKERGAGIRLVGEPEFLRMLGADEESAGFSRMYTAVQVSRIAEVPLSEVRSWQRRGLLPPSRVSNRLAWFDFSDILLARHLSRLAAAGVSPARVRSSLEQVSRWLPGAERIIQRLELSGRRLGVRLPDGSWAEPSGQRLLDLQDGAEAGGARVEPFRVVDGREGGWLAAAEEAEERGDPRGAADAYARALADGPDPETLFNLGNALYEIGHEGEAAERYLQALDMDKGFVEAWNNLGNAMAAMGKLEEAVNAYRMALALEPEYTDAGCNLATVLDRLGRGREGAGRKAGCQEAIPGRLRLRLLKEAPPPRSPD
jgi:tetratricopeptide (TPR) repeat protein